ncbi:MAG TPA: transposase [Ktedonobacteraceae bacterium]|jgi:hypothetical protein
MDIEGLEHAEKWAVENFGTAELGNLRRTDRLVKMATAIAENPSASLPESMRNWADTLAAYLNKHNENLKDLPREIRVEVMENFISAERASNTRTNEGIIVLNVDYYYNGE